MRERARATYRLNSSQRKMRVTIAYRKDQEGIKYKRRQTYKLYCQNFIDKRSLDRLLACAVSKKYKKLPDNLKKYSSNLSNDLETEHLVKSCMHFRDTNHKRFIITFRKLKLLVLATLSKLHETSEESCWDLVCIQLLVNPFSLPVHITMLH